MLDECYNRVKCGIRTCQLLLIEKNKARRDLNDFPKFTRNCKFLEGKGYLTWAKTQLVQTNGVGLFPFLPLELGENGGGERSDALELPTTQTGKRNWGALADRIENTSAGQAGTTVPLLSASLSF